jgi:hypothetical protein
MLAKQYVNLNVDIVILAFVVLQNDFSSLYLKINFRAACSRQTSLIKEDALKLLSCFKLATDIDTYQSIYSKKVLLSISSSRQSIIFNTTSNTLAFRSIL